MSKIKKNGLLVLRIFVGLVFLISGLGKLIDTGYVNYALVRLLASHFYWLIEYAAPIVIAISIIELIIAAFLFWGKKLKWALSAALVLLLIFSGVMGYFYWQGMQVQSCGCFGAFGFGGGLGFSLLKNLVLIACIIAAYLLMPSKNRNVAFTNTSAPEGVQGAGGRRKGA